MRERSDIWKRLVRDGQFTCESVLVIGEKTYTAITAPIIDRPVMPTPLSIGKCASASLQVSVMSDKDIDTTLPIVVKARLTDGNEYSEWLEFGTFFIDQINKEYEGLVNLICYDSMLKLDQYYTFSGKLMYIPIRDVIIDIANIIGVELDERTAIHSGIINWHKDEESKFTMRQILESIAVISGGNWIITENNKLRLVPVITSPGVTYDIVDEHYNTISSTTGERIVYKHTDDEREEFTPVLGSFKTLGIMNKSLKLLSKIQSGTQQRFVNNGWSYIKGDNIEPDEYSNEYLNFKITSGEIVNIPVVVGNFSTGKDIIVKGATLTDAYNNKSSTFKTEDGYVVCAETSVSINSLTSVTARAQNLGEALSGMIYTPYEATIACFDPAAEIGDWVKIGNVRSVIYNLKLTLDTNFMCDLSAPNSNEVESLYPYPSKIDLNKIVQSNKDYAGVSISNSDGVTVTVSNNDTGVASFSLNENSISFNTIDQNGDEKPCIYYDIEKNQYHITKDVIIDGITNDTGWKEVQLSSDFFNYSMDGSNPLVYRKSGKYVEIRGAVKPSRNIEFESSTAGVIIGTVPSDFCPSATVTALCQGSNYAIWFMSVNSSGNISIARYRIGGTAKELNDSQWLPMHITYFVG